MKKNYRLFGLLLCLNSTLGITTTSYNVAYGAERISLNAAYAPADEEIKTITLSKEGTLGDFIPKTERHEIVNLRIVGPMYYKDFWVLHSCPNLEYLDLSLATITDDGKGVANCIPENTFDGHEAIKTVIFPKTLKAIGDYAFRSTTIEKIEIPESVDSIAAGVFQFCNNLSEINIPSGVKAIGNRAFCGCKSLESMILPDDIEVLNEGVFQDCVFLKSINLPKNLKKIGYAAFSGTALTDIHIYDKVTAIGGKAFAGITLNSVTCEAITPPDMQLNTFANTTYDEATLYIPAEAMDDYLDMATWGQFSKVEEYINKDNPEDPDGYTKVSSKAGTLNDIMADMQNIVKLRLLGEVNNQDFAFIRTLTSLESIDMTKCKIVDDGNGVANRIPDGAFEKMTKLTSVKMSASANEIGKRAFAETGLQSVVLPDGIVTLGVEAFIDSKSLTEVVISNIDLRVSEKAFSGCTQLTSLVLPAHCKEIAAGAFANCSSLELLGLPSTLEVIGESAFAGTAVKTLGMGSSMQNIGAKAFDNVNLTSVTCLAEVPPVLDVTAFMQSVYDNATLKIVRAYEEAYKNNDTWSKFKNIELDNTPIMDKDGYVHIHCIETGDVELFASLDIVQKAEKIRVTGIADRTDFYYLSMLTNMQYLDVSTIKILATYDSEGNVKYPENWLPENSFMGCKSIKQIQLPEDIEGIGSWAFAESSLEEIYVPRSVKEIGYQAFFYCKQLTKVIIDGELITTPRSLFSQCSALTEVVLPETLEILNYETFYKCTNLENVKLPKSLKEIGEAAFENTSIVNLVIPENVNIIGQFAFLNSDLEELACMGAAPDAHLKAFTNTQKSEIIVRVRGEHLDSYLDHVVWSQFANIVDVDDPNDTGIEDITAEEKTIAMVDGMLQITEKAANVAVYDITGRKLVHMNNVAAGTMIQLPTNGVMVVVIDNRTYKVFN